MTDWGPERNCSVHTMHSIHTYHWFKIHINIFIAEYKQPYWQFITNIILKKQKWNIQFYSKRLLPLHKLTAFIYNFFMASNAILCLEMCVFKDALE